MPDSFTHLHLHTEFSMLDGAARVSDVVAAAAADGQPAVLSDVDVAELKAAVGGDQEFARISQWAVANLAPADLADYNAAVDSGNNKPMSLIIPFWISTLSRGGPT